MRILPAEGFQPNPVGRARCDPTSATGPGSAQTAQRTIGRRRPTQGSCSTTV